MVLDGYTGFTPVQYRLIGILLKLCRNVFVTVSATMEPGMDLTAESDETDLFDMSRKMTGKLKQLAEENGAKIYQDLVFSKRPLVRFRNSPALDHLERTFFSAIRIPGTTAERGRLCWFRQRTRRMRLTYHEPDRGTGEKGRVPLPGYRPGLRGSSGIWPGDHEKL